MSVFRRTIQAKRTWSWILLLLVGLAVAPAPAAAQDREGAPSVAQPQAPALSGPRPQASPQLPASRPRVTLKDGLVSVEVKDLPLFRLLDEIARQARIAFIPVGETGGNTLVSVKYQGVPLEEALRNLLKEHDAFYFYGTEGKAPAALRAIWVYAKGKGSGHAPVPPEVWGSTAELQGRLKDADPVARAKAVEVVITRKGEQATNELLDALNDQDALVRTQALYGALNAGIAVPPGLLVTLLTADPSEDVRFLALEALAGSPDARAVAERALNDPSPAVQNKAKEILGLRNRPRSTHGEPRPSSAGQP